MTEVHTTWNQKVLIVDLKIEVSILVNKNTQVGDLTLQLVRNAGKNENHFLDHSFWWPEEKRWLKQSKKSLQQYGIFKEIILHFTPAHKDIRIKLPNQSYRISRVDFSSEAGLVLEKFCKEINLSNSKELSFIRIGNETGQKIRCFSCKNEENKKPTLKTVMFINPTYQSTRNLEKESSIYKNEKTKIFIDKQWINHSQTLMAQGIKEFDLLQLTFKFTTCLYFNKCLDTTYNKFLYEFAKNQILEYESLYNMEEAFIFAGLQLHIEKLQTIESEIKQISKKDIESALSELQKTIGDEEINHDIFAVPKLSGNLLIQKRFIIKFYKSNWCEYQDFSFKIYKNGFKKGIETFDLKFAEIDSNIDVKQNLYLIDIKKDEFDLNIKFDNQENFIHWWAAFKSASKGNSMASALFKKEMESMKSYLKLKQPRKKTNEKLFYNLIPSEYLSTTFLKGSMQSLIKKIGESEQNIQNLTLSEARVSYIKLWQSLSTFGYNYFTVKFSNGKKKEILGIGKDRLVRAKASMKVKKTWRYSSLIHWTVNWNENSIKLDFEDEQVTFVCIISDCEIIHDFIYGYIMQ